ncbi:MAG TPA: protein kinase [Ktedonobacteraceae bacterium]|nr:protein kinase [Ktedonobacteraceae bacterium]
MAALEGRTLNRYQLRRMVGRGGMADVYEAYDEHFQRRVAIKVFKREEESMLLRFMREARLMASLNNPHLVPVYDMGECEIDGFTRYYIVMPFMEGGTLRTRIRRSPLTLDETCTCLQDIASALDYIHARGIIHRDIKASNVLLDAAGKCYLTDLGIAHIVTDATQLTTTGNVLGTVDYIAPELFKPNRKSDVRSDLYSLGVLLYEMVTGQLPFTSENQIAVVSMHMNMPPPSPRLLAPHVSPQVEWVMLRALEKDPEQRYASAGELADAFYQAVALSSNSSSQEDNNVSTIDADRLVLPPAMANPSWQNSLPVAGASPARGRPSPLNDATEGYRRSAPARSANSPSQKAMEDLPAFPADEPPQRRRSPLVALLALVVLIALLVPLVYALVPRGDSGNGNSINNAGQTSTSAANSPTSRPSPTPNLTATALAAAAATATARANATATAIAAVTATARAQATATAGVIVTATSGKPGYSDALNNANNPATVAADWDQSSSCVFQSDGYHAISGGGLQGCKEAANTYQNVAITVNMRILSGHSGGLFFRVNTNFFGSYSGYLFEIDSTGRYKISRSSNYSLNITTLQDWTASSAIKQGNAVTNTLQVIAKGNSLSFYVNGVFLVTLTDSTYSSAGGVAFLASGSGTPTEVVYSNLKIYPSS